MTVHPRTALLLMDFQRGIVEPAAGSGSLEAVAAARRALDHARSRGHAVIHVTVQFRPSYVEIASSNKRLAGIRSAGRLQEGDPATAIVAELQPNDGEPVVVKRRFSALAHTDLVPILRGMQIDRLVLCGLSTSGVILSSVRGGADDDWRMTVLSDACADPDPEVHRVLMTKILPTQADVITVDDFVGTY